MSGEDVALYMADPEYAVSLGIEPPRCVECGGAIRLPPHGWDGETALRHLVPAACGWVKGGVIHSDILTKE